jgi:hypothetical protein
MPQRLAIFADHFADWITLDLCKDLDHISGHLLAVSFKESEAPDHAIACQNKAEKCQKHRKITCRNNATLIPTASWPFRSAIFEDCPVKLRNGETAEAHKKATVSPYRKGLCR